MDREYLPGDVRDRIADLSKEFGIGQNEIARRIGMSQGAFSRFMSGVTDKLSYAYVIKIAELFGVSTDFLLGVANNPTRINYDVTKLGLTAESAKRLFHEDLQTDVVNLLPRVERNPENPSWNLMALSMKVTCDQAFCPERSVLEQSPVITRIYNQTSFTLVLKAFLLGCIEKDEDDMTLANHSEVYCSQLEGRESEKAQAIFMVRVAAMLGKYYWIDNPQSAMFEGCAEWLLSAQLHGSMDYSKARRFLLYTLLNSKAARSIGREESFVTALRVSLFEIDPLGMFYKTCILDFLAVQNQHDLIKEYINALYGESCSKISLEDHKADMHERFSLYGKLVEPDLMQQFSEQLKWDVVGYLGYNEYALHAPLDCFDVIINHDPTRWSDLGAQLYAQSEIADCSSNDAAYKIKDRITEAAALCGIADYWELRKWHDEFRLKPDQISHALFSFINTATSLETLQVIWILCCGLHSWYTQSERLGAKSIYDACIERARELNVDFAAFVAQTTPQWNSILIHLTESLKGLDEYDVYKSRRLEEQDAIFALYRDMSVEEALGYLKTVENTRWALDHYSVVLEKVLAYSESVNESLTKLLCSFCIYLQGKGWTHDKYDQIISPLLTVLGWDAFWAIAESNATQLSDYDYQTSMRNMQLLFTLMCHDNPIEMESLFAAELHTQRKWSSGNGHFNVRKECEGADIHFANVPDSLAEMALYILLEQADMQNSRKMEIAIYAIYLQGLQFREVMHIITEQWLSFSRNQEECLLIVIARWVNAGVCPKELIGFLIDMYGNCSELPRKYYLHSILLQLRESGVEASVVSCTAPAISYEPSADGFADEDNCYRNFLSLIERYTGKEEADAIRRCLYEASPLEHYAEDYFANDGDSNIPVISIFPGRIFYSKEKCGDWAAIPLSQKKARLIPPEDPFLLTEMPRMAFNSDWFPNITVTHDGKRNPELTISDLRKIAHSYIDEDEIVLAASLWYPWGYREGTMYTESSKIDLRIKMGRPIHFDCCLGNYGLLINENSMDESRDTTFGMGGVSLFNRVCGGFKLYHGNCQLAPSSVWKDYFKCNPKNDDPYTWVDRTGMEVLRFERIASPFREVMREAYIRQPILFRWICKKSWLEGILRSEKLCLIPFDIQEEYPYLGN